MSEQPVVELVGVSKTYATDPPVRPLEDIELQVEGGSVVAVMGVSGKGKSTMLNIMGGLMSPDCGQVLFKGEDLAQASSERIDALHRRGIGFAFQTPYLISAFTARENLEFAFRMSKCPDPKRQAEQALSDFGLIERADHMPYELSAGQKRRLVIARALGEGHSLLLADEPTNDLDEQWADYVFERFAQFASDESHAVVLVTHDVRYAAKADKVYVLDAGKLNPRD
ncbi:MAG: ATP-binding cassette domain-containing protein [Eggerthellales bacterium]|nr:ATP-binding cassette domain-containing protein [Eggerthellales bacterium]